jgi:hypothetical protein
MQDSFYIKDSYLFKVYLIVTIQSEINRSVMDDDKILIY